MNASSWSSLVLGFLAEVFENEDEDEGRGGNNK
jgi:hypothetical protein